MIRLLFFLLLPSAVLAHSRWACPKPRNSDPGITIGPCGDETDDLSNDDPLMEVSPGPMLVQWEEAVSHDGSPFRIALSQDGTDTELPVCVFLDHIPHHDDLNPNIEDESTYTLYSMVIMIPDVACTRCSLHLANMKTADEGNLGSPNGRGCTDPNGTCQTVYRSCTIPFTITGTIPRSSFQCTNTNPTDWPTQWIGDNGAVVNAGTIGVYRRESGIWGSDSFLQNIPNRYVDSSSASSCRVDDTPTLTPNGDDDDDDDGVPNMSFIALFLNWLLRLFGLR